jgi:hypothetical protein
MAVANRVISPEALYKSTGQSVHWLATLASVACLRTDFKCFRSSFFAAASCAAMTSTLQSRRRVFSEEARELPCGFQRANQSCKMWCRRIVQSGQTFSRDSVAETGNGPLSFLPSAFVVTLGGAVLPSTSPRPESKPFLLPCSSKACPHTYISQCFRQ